MTLIAVERIKLFSTRSPWWCMAIAIAITIGFTALAAANSSGRFALTVAVTQSGYQFGLMVIMVMAALAVTTEYRFGTMKTTFQAIPNRTSVILAKTTIVALLAGVIGEITAFGSFGIAKLIQPNAGLSLTTADDWRNVAGMGLVYIGAAIIAIAVGLLVRQTAAAVAILLIYPLLIENLVGLIPNIGSKIQVWLPFHATSHFLSGSAATRETASLDYPYGPWLGLAYFAGIAVALLIAAIVVTANRDA